jgi:hypothetical protein
MRTCAQCNQKLEPGSQPRRRYCSDRCKLAAHRDPSVRLADQALEILQPKTVLAGGFMDPGIDWRDRLKFLQTHYPIVWDTFGEDALTSAAHVPSRCTLSASASASRRITSRRISGTVTVLDVDGDDPVAGNPHGVVRDVHPALVDPDDLAGPLTT